MAAKELSPRERASETVVALAKLREDFKRRVEMLEREHVRRLLATFQEFQARAFAVKNGKPSPDFMGK